MTHVTFYSFFGGLSHHVALEVDGKLQYESEICYSPGLVTVNSLQELTHQEKYCINVSANFGNVSPLFCLNVLM